MKNWILIFFVVLISCNGENVPDCFQNSGPIIQKEYSVDAFDRIIVFERVELIVKDEPTQKVVVETGEYLLNEIEVEVKDGQLTIRNENACNLTRDYGITKVFVSSPDLIEIRNSSGLPVSSDGMLNYDNLRLLSEDFNAPELYHTDGDFNLEVNSNTVTIITNDISNVFMSGNVENLNVRFFSGDGRFEGRNLTVDNVTVFHRGSNDIIVNPLVSISGEIRSTGNVVSLNRPQSVDVVEYYTGRLIFQD